MIRKKDIQAIDSKLDRLSESVIRKATKYDREHDFLEQIDIHVNKAYAYFDETSLRHVVKITYSIPETIIYVEDDGECVLNPRFKAMNELKLIPISDLDKVANAINKVKELNSGGDNA